MKIQFTVTGSTRAELEESASKILASLLEGDVALTVELTVTPLLERFGEDVPDMWEAQVEAVA